MLDAVTPALGKHGLAVIQTTALTDGKTVLQTHLYHESGESITSIYPLPEIADSQKFGAALTYARRYALCAILCVTADEDDDANMAQTPKQDKPRETGRLQSYKPNPVPQKTVSNGDHPNNGRVKAVRKLLGVDGNAVLGWLKTEKLVNSPAELEKPQVDQLIQWIGAQWAINQGMHPNHAANSFDKHVSALIAQNYEELEAIALWMEYVQQQPQHAIEA